MEEIIEIIESDTIETTQNSLKVCLNKEKPVALQTARALKPEKIKSMISLL